MVSCSCPSLAGACQHSVRAPCIAPQAVFALSPSPGARPRCSLAMVLSAAALRAWVAELDRIERQDCRPLVYVSKCNQVLI